VSTIQRVHLTLEIDPASDPVTGALRDLAGQNVEFAGWLGFAAALEELISSAGRQRPATIPALSREHPEQP
jgi:hypothetical protein